LGKSREEAIRINRPLGRRRIKSVLKKIAEDINKRNKEVAVMAYLLGDFLQDGAIDGSILMTLGIL